MKQIQEIPKITKKDERILQQLEMNARMPITQLAKAIQQSKQLVKYRLDNLEKQNIIQGYNAIIDINKLNKTIYVIYLKLIKISSTKEKEWIKQLNKNQHIIATGKNAGHWDLTLVVLAQDNLELNKILNKILKSNQDKIKQKIITTELESTYLSLGIIHEKTSKEFKTINEKQKTKLDEKDNKLLLELAKNCRTSLVDLALKLKMSPNGVKNKIKNLEKNKIIIGYKTKINYEKLGYIHFRVFINLNKSTEQINQKIKNYLKPKNQIESISTYLGYADIDFRCYAKNILEFYKLIAEIKDKFVQEILEINSIINFSWHEINYYPKAP